MQQQLQKIISQAKEVKFESQSPDRKTDSIDQTSLSEQEFQFENAKKDQLLLKSLQKKIEQSFVKNTEGKQLLAKNSGQKIMRFDFTPDKLMMLLYKEKLEKLEKYWLSTEDEALDLTQFCQMMINYMPRESDDQTYELLYGCIKMFSEVDINGDGMMEWSEFVQYIIDAVSANSIKRGEGQVSVAEQIAKIKSKKFNKFGIDQKNLDKSNHLNLIHKAVFCRSADLTMQIEKYGKEIKLYDNSIRFIKRIKVDLKREGFVTSVAYDERNQIFGAAATDGYIHFFQKKRNRFESLKSLPAPCIQQRIFYLNKLQMWITSGRDFKLRQWNILKGGSILLTLDLHQDEITDCIEIINPSCIVTVSLDGSMVIYDITHKDLIRRVENAHEKGIRGIRYQNYNGAQMITLGHEVYVKVWSPESLVSDIYLGKLESHQKPIVDAQYLNRAPFIVSIDLGNNLIFWDIQNFIPIQQLLYPVSVPQEGIVVQSNDIFWTYGRRFVQFDTFQEEEDEETADKQNPILDDHPIAAYLNYYQLSIMVIKKSEVRIYDIQKGQFQQLQNSIFEGDKKSEITRYKIDKRNRKAYITNDQGLIQVSNCENGVLIKTVREIGDDNKEMDQDISSKHSINSDDEGIDFEQFAEKKQSSVRELTQELKRQNQIGNACALAEAKSQEIVDMHLVWEDDENIMMLCCNSNQYMVYDEADPDQSQLVRTVKGGHLDEITIMAFDWHLSLVATGCINGEIAIYDFEMSKVEALLHGHSGDITALQFISPYPLLISASMDCSIFIWGVRPIPEPYLYVCIKRYQNLSWSNGKEVPAVPNRIQVWQNFEKGIRPFRKLKQQQLQATTYRNFEQNFVFSLRPLKEIYMEEFPSRKNFYDPPSEDYMLKKVLDGEQFYQMLEDPSSKTFITLITENQLLHNQKWEEECERIYIYLGDEYGFLKIWDITKTITDSSIAKVKPFQQTRVAYNPRRQENVDCLIYADQLRQSLKLKPAKLPQLLDPGMNGVQIREAKAHFDVITSLEKIQLDDCQGVISTSKDNKVRFWSRGLDMWGTLNQKTDAEDPKWRFPTQMKDELRKKEIEKMNELMDNLDMGLKKPRKMLVIKSGQQEEIKQEQEKTRTKWLQQQEEKEKMELELQEQQKKMHEQHERRMERDEQILRKIQETIAEQTLQYQLLQMNLPKKFADGPARDLQNTLNEMHYEMTEQMSTSLIDHESPRKQGETQVKDQRKKQNMTIQSDRRSILVKKREVSFKTPIVPPKTQRIPQDQDSNFNSPMDTNQKKTKSSMNISQKSPSPERSQSQLATDLPTERKQKLLNLIGLAKADPIKSKLNDSLEDRENVMQMGMRPKIRNILESLGKKDRFSTQQLQLPNIFSKQSALLQFTDQSINNDKYLRGENMQRHGTLSIADSEIQMVSDGGGIGLSYDQSKVSIHSIFNHKITSKQVLLSTKLNNISSRPSVLNTSPFNSIQKPTALIAIRDSSLKTESKTELTETGDQTQSILPLLSQPIERGSSQITVGKINLKLGFNSQGGVPPSNISHNNPISSNFNQPMSKLAQQLRSPEKLVMQFRVNPSFPNLSSSKTLEPQVINQNDKILRNHGSESPKSSMLSKDQMLNIKNVVTRRIRDKSGEETNQTSNRQISGETEQEERRERRILKISLGRKLQLEENAKKASQREQTLERERRKNQEFMALKKKYVGEESQLGLERQLFRNKLEEQKRKVQSLLQ